MFDQGCYQSAMHALDKDFRNGNYYVTSSPFAAARHVRCDVTDARPSENFRNRNKVEEKREVHFKRTNAVPSGRLTGHRVGRFNSSGDMVDRSDSSEDLIRALDNSSMNGKWMEGTRNGRNRQSKGLRDDYRYVGSDSRGIHRGGANFDQWGGDDLEHDHSGVPWNRDIDASMYQERTGRNFSKARENPIPRRAKSTDSLLDSGPDRSTNERPRSSRMIYDGVFEPRSSRSKRSSAANGDREFLSDVQQELESQRRYWSGEMARLVSPTNNNARSRSGLNADKNSFVDTSSGLPVFKAFVDVSEYPLDSVTVNIDKLSNKIIVEAGQGNSPSQSVASTFTQKIAMPRYADDSRMVARVNKAGLLRLEIPLMFYFPGDAQHDGSQSKSFINQVRTDPVDGSHVMEVVVKPGSDVSLRDLRVEVVENKLVVFSDKIVNGFPAKRTVVKTYTLPEMAIVQNITSELTSDGFLTVSIPIYTPHSRPRNRARDFVNNR